MKKTNGQKLKNHRDYYIELARKRTDEVPEWRKRMFKPSPVNPKMA